MATIHVAEIKTLARQAHGDTLLCEKLFADMQCSERHVAVHAAWTLTHLPKEDNILIDNHREALVQQAIGTTDMSLRRLVLTLLERLDWSFSSDEAPEYYLALLDFCLEHMMLPTEPYGVRSLCMKIAYKIALPYPELLGELHRSLLMLEPSELGAGVRHTRNKILNIKH